LNRFFGAWIFSDYWSAEKVTSRFFGTEKFNFLGPKNLLPKIHMPKNVAIWTYSTNKPLSLSPKKLTYQNNNNYICIRWPYVHHIFCVWRPPITDMGDSSEFIMVKKNLPLNFSAEDFSAPKIYLTFLAVQTSLSDLLNDSIQDAWEQGRGVVVLVQDSCTKSLYNPSGVNAGMFHYKFIGKWSSITTHPL